jgi:hypothetical protein
VDFMTNCTVDGSDPGVLAIDSAASGASGACAGMSFTVTSIGLSGDVRIAPNGGAHIVLPSPGSSCRVRFTFSVLKSPTVDARPAAGLQTLQRVEATAVSDQGNPVFRPSLGDPTTVLPGTPVLTSTAPASPANDNHPRIVGGATPGTTLVSLYDDAACSGTPIGRGTRDTLASPGLIASVGDDETTTIYATAADSAGSVSGCSAGVAYVEDSTAPPAPTAGASTPGSPANDNQPRIQGSAPAGTAVRLYADATCAAYVAGPVPAADFASPGVTASVADDTTTTFYSTATDAAGNRSACSSNATTYVEDSAAPQTTITSGPSGGPFSLGFSFVSSEPGSRFECRTDLDALARCTSPFTTAPLSAGYHTFEVRAIDAAGNVDPTTAGLRFTLSAVGAVVEGSVAPFPGPRPVRAAGGDRGRARPGDARAAGLPRRQGAGLRRHAGRQRAQGRHGHGRHVRARRQRRPQRRRRPRLPRRPERERQAARRDRRRPPLRRSRQRPPHRRRRP